MTGLVSANKQAVDDARHGRYMAATFGYLANAGVTDAQQITDDDAYDQWAQGWSTMTGVHVMRTAKPADYHVTPAEVAIPEGRAGPRRHCRDRGARQEDPRGHRG